MHKFIFYVVFFALMVYDVFGQVLIKEERLTDTRQIFADNLNRLIREKGIEQQKIAAALNVAPSTVSSWTLAKRFPRADVMQQLAELFGVSVSDIVYEHDAPTPLPHPDLLPVVRRSIPVLGNVAAGQPIFAEEELIDFEDSDTPCDFALRVKGNSMYPLLMNGDIIFVRRQPDVHDGQIAVVLIDDAANVKYVFHIKGGLELRSENPAFDPQIYTENNSNTLSILGLVVAYKRVLK